MCKLFSQVADFGLAKFSSDTNTHVSTRVMGTFGYAFLFSFTSICAPIYFLRTNTIDR